MRVENIKWETIQSFIFVELLFSSLSLLFSLIYFIFILFYFIYLFSSCIISGNEGYRSPCLSYAKRTLYHLSYIPINIDKKMNPLGLRYIFIYFFFSLFLSFLFFSFSFSLFLFLFLSFSFYLIFFNNLFVWYIVQHSSKKKSSGSHSTVCKHWLIVKMHPVGFEPTHLSIAVLETAPLDRSGTNAFIHVWKKYKQ